MNTITRTFPRTMRQAEADPMAWWESAEAAAAEEAHIRAVFDDVDGNKKGESRSSRWFHRVLYSIGLVVACAGQWLGHNFMGWPG